MSMNFTHPDYRDQCQFSESSLILAVDDDDDNLMLLSYALELFNCTFIGETSGQAALTIAKERQPGLILSDILLPDMNGIEFIRQLKQNSGTCNIPVIAVTALARAEDRTELLAAGFVDYISKPYMIDDLETMIRQHFPLSARPQLSLS